MLLNDLINVLDSVPGNYDVIFSDGNPVGYFDSWRGVYSELTLTPGSKIRKSSGLLTDARFALQIPFQGYKGGEYFMNLDTPVWADDYGDCGYMGILGYTIDHDKKQVILDRVYVGDYR